MPRSSTGSVIDLTRAQFGKPDGPTWTFYASLDDAGRDWCGVLDSPHERTPRALPPIA